MKKLFIDDKIEYCNDCPYFSCVEVCGTKIVNCKNKNMPWKEIFHHPETEFKIPGECALPEIEIKKNNMTKFKECFDKNSVDKDLMNFNEFEKGVVEFLELFLPWYNKKDWDFRNDENPKNTFKYFLENSKEGDRDER